MRVPLEKGELGQPEGAARERPRLFSSLSWSCATILFVCIGFPILANFGHVVRFLCTFRRGMAYMHEQRAMAAPIGNLTLNGHALAWYVLDDVVMGGHSFSSLAAAPRTDGEGGGLIFYGVISTRGGGFASCSTRETPLGLSASTVGFRLSVTGDGALYKLAVRTSASVWDPIWQADFPTPSLEAGVRHELFVPLTEFRASLMGQPVRGLTLHPSRIQSVGLNLALIDSAGNPNPHFGDGPFTMTLHSVDAVDASDSALTLGSTHSALKADRGENVGARLFKTDATMAAAASESARPSPSGTMSPTQPPFVNLATFDGAATARSWRVTNDPVMGGRSTSHFTAGDRAGRFAGTCAIVPFLHAPGFAKLTAYADFPDASAYAGGALWLTIRSATPGYAGFKVAFSSDHMPTPSGTIRHGAPSFKADFRVPAAAAGGTWATVRLPFDSFSVDWSEFTGSCATRDPDGTQHVCCSAEHAEVCPLAKHLASLRSLSVWAEGTQGDFDIELRSIAVGP